MTSTVPVRETAVVFDLDGTLIDPFEGITQSIRFALHEMGRPAPPPQELTWCIGPPLYESFTTLFGGSSVASHADVEEAIRLYRVRFSRVGMYECDLYDGVADVLIELVGQGFTLFVATSKPHVYAVPIIEHLEIAPYFKRVYGAELDGTRRDKGALLAYVCDQERLDCSQTIMIGDRRYDIEGARQVGMRSIGVLFGYGAPGELKAAAPDRLVEAPGDIPAAVQRLIGDAP
jgi:phosphoglycolate phosphatase